MDCRETQTLLTAFHDGELPDAERTRVENHLRGCLECGRLLADLARADEVAGVPDPGPGYWDRFNARVADRIEREAEGPGVSVLRPEQGWMRQQLRFLVPAVAAAALVVVVVRYGGHLPFAPRSTPPPAESVKERSTLESAESNRAAKAPAATPPAIAKEGSPTVAREERDRLADRVKSVENKQASRLRAAASPCETARELAAQERFGEAEAAQRECLSQDPSPPTQEKGLIFLAELLDRQTRFAEADAVLTEVHRQFPKSVPLTLYRQQRPMVQKKQIPVPATGPGR